jgi:hypothetical protein
MIHIDETLPSTQKDIQTALLGMWGVEEISEALTDIALGALRVRILTATSNVEPLSYAKGATTAYASSLLICAYTDGTSDVRVIDSPTTLLKMIHMGVLIARQV